MTLLQVIVPEKTTNLIENPSFEIDLSRWNAFGASVARTATYQRFGVYSLAITPDTGSYSGVQYDITLNPNTTYTFSVYVFGANGVPYRLQAYDVDAGVSLTTQPFTGTSMWERQELTFTTGSNTNIRLYVQKNNSSSTDTFYIDAAQCEAKPYSTTYCDGDQDGCSWEGTPHASRSVRDARSRAGGRVYDIGDANLRITEIHGAGMPPVENILQEVALLPGALHQRIKVKPRVLTITFVASTTDPDKFYEARKALIERIKPDTLD